MPLFLWDWTLILLVPAIVLSLYAQYKVKTTFNKYSKVPSAQGLTGAQAARRLLDSAGLQDVQIEAASGRLSDHYDPRSRVLRLSKDVGGKNSLASLGVAAHEAGHALQHAQGYGPMRLRSALVPAASLGSNLGMILGIVLFSAAVFFTVVTLPVEINASQRAMKQLTSHGILVSQEAAGAQKVLNAAALTYVAAALMAILNLVRLILISRR